MPNNLLPDDATFETSLGNWFTFPAGSPAYSLARVTSPTPHAGSGVAKATRISSAGAGTNLQPILNGPPPRDSYCATAGQTATFSVWLRVDSGNAHPGEYGAFFRVSIDDATFTQINDEYAPALGGTDNWIRLSSSAWTQFQVGPFTVGTGPQPFDTLFAVQFAWVPDLTVAHFAGGAPSAGDILYVSDASWDGECPPPSERALRAYPRSDSLGRLPTPRHPHYHDTAQATPRRHPVAP